MSRQSKVLWFDVETSGLDAKASCILTLAMLIEIDGEIVEEAEFTMRPFSNCIVAEEALKVNGLTLEQIAAFPDERVAMARWKKTLEKYIGKRDKTDKFVPAGYNVGFDIDFLYGTFGRLKDRFSPGSYLFTAPIDVRTLVGITVAKCGMRLENYQLKTVCEKLGIAFKAHDAMSDVKATRALYGALKHLI